MPNHPSFLAFLNATLKEKPGEVKAILQGQVTEKLSNYLTLLNMAALAEGKVHFDCGNQEKEALYNFIAWHIAPLFCDYQKFLRHLQKLDKELQDNNFPEIETENWLASESQLY